MTSMLLLLIQIICTLFCAALILSAWFYWLRIPAFNPLVSNVTQITNWLVIPLRKILPNSRHVDIGSLVAAYLTCVVQLLLVLLLIMGGQLGAVLIYIPLEALLVLAKNILNLIFWLTLFYTIMSWINPLSPAMTLFRALLEPVLAPIRRLPLLNKMQGIDLSPLVLVIICQILLVGVRSFSSPVFQYLI